ncbi:carboxyltransferase domain-containing protein [Microbacterium sp. NM3R9]|uniref:5-oxoprolinase subunit B/C family protein n=1 Tax=Microbacterium thalli TaxID=3027921 RepID=UPI00236733F8|nr:carboxyltransferase domain-containing protein [Microbacterium thalli]MDN8548082.1 carboxyltransferase domain-containing protein [Microbacterium thalli]
MRMLRMGADAVLVEVGGLTDAVALHARLVADPPPGVVDIVPAARTVLVRADPRMLSLEGVRAWITRAAATAAAPPVTAAAVIVPVVYDGADLAETAALLGTSADALAARHESTAWTVAFTGFAPGFGYLIGDGWDLDVPRRASPRTRVPAGSVALAGAFSGAYPRDTPGGWQLIGTTDAVLFDPDAARPALLAPGAAVRFAASRAVSVGRRETESEGAQPPGSGIRVVAAGARATFQDAGRPGRAAEGIARSGAADAPAWALANRLLGNRPDAAAIEVVLGGFRAVAERDLAVVVTGGWAPLTIDGRARDPYVVHPWPAGSELRMDAFLAGARAYLAVRGGWLVPPAVGSRSTDTLSGLGPAPVRTDDRVAVGDETAGPIPALPLHPWGLPPVATDAAPLDIPFVPGPRGDWITTASRRALTDAVWTVSADADRVGIRLGGPVLDRARTDELPSEGMSPGAIQVPPSGLPVVFGADGPVTGGYPVVGVVTAAGRARLAQVRPGDRVRLRPTAPPTTGA